jgi:hypothetical protein
MNHQHSNAAPDLGSILKFVTSLVWRSKWLIGGASVVVAAVAFALTQANTVQIWSGRTTLAIGLAPNLDYILLPISPPMAAIETPRSTVARISGPAFKGQVISRAAFEPATAALSRSMVSSSLRAIDLNTDRDVALELSAGSAADVQAAFHAVAAEIERAHGDILNRRLQFLQVRIDEAKSRIAVIEKSTDRFNDRIFSATSDEKAQLRPSILTPTPATSVAAWNELQDRIQLHTNLKQLSEPSVLRLEADTSIVGPRSVGTLRSSLLAGLAMFIAMIVFTMVVNSPMRTSAD